MKRHFQVGIQFLSLSLPLSTDSAVVPIMWDLVLHEDLSTVHSVKSRFFRENLSRNFRQQNVCVKSGRRLL